MTVIAVDVESNGIDVKFGAKPFMVQRCDDKGNLKYWRWPVNPLTREVDVDFSEVLQIQDELDAAEQVVFHNAKFDIRALKSVDIVVPREKVICTLFLSHILGSNHKHNLTDTAINHIGVNIQPYEDAVEKATTECRQAVRNGKFSSIDTSNWRLAKEGDETMPSVKGSSKRDEDKPWKADMWLPLAVAEELLGHRIDDPYNVSAQDKQRLMDVDYPLEWLTAVITYGLKDPETTLMLWMFGEPELRRRDLWDIFIKGRMPLVSIAVDLEEHGVTRSRKMTEKLIKEYSSYVDYAQAECIAVAEQFDFDIDLPAGASPNDSLKEFMWGSVRLWCPRCGKETLHKEWDKGSIERIGDGIICPKCLKRKAKPGPATVVREIRRNKCLGLEKQYDPETGSPSLAKGILDHYTKTLEAGPALDFVKSLTSMRSRQTALSYLHSYERFSIPINAHVTNGVTDWYRMHPSANPTGTDTLRWSFNSPNSANFSKKEDFNLRYCFGPTEGREWWSMDGKNLELRIPAFEADEKDLVWIFSNEKDPPYYGSYHLVVFDLLYPELFAKHGKAVKELYESTYYQWIKNGNFAIIYGCQQKKADATYHVSGAFEKVRYRFPRIAALNDKYKGHATRYGYVETIPDKSVCSRRGYPVLVSRSEDGRVLPTTPFNYHISTTAMQWTNGCMRKTENQIKEWRKDGFDGFLTLQVHDELVWDFPRGEGEEHWNTNLWRTDILRDLMQSCGDDVNVPTPVSREVHSASYATGKTL